MEILNLVFLNIIMLIGPVCLFFAIRDLVVHFLEREPKESRSVPKMTFCAWGTRRHIFNGRRG